MWLFFTLLFSFFLAIVNYVDEYLTAHHALPETADVHTRVGGLILMSMFATVLGALVVILFFGLAPLSSFHISLAVASGVFLGLTWISYFYLLNYYAVFLVIPLFQLSSIWLLAVELATGGSITTISFIGVALLILGAYLIDSGTFKWQIPTSLLFAMLPVSVLWAGALYSVKLASSGGASIYAITFWQFIAVFLLGVLLFTCVGAYRNGFLQRLKLQRRTFLSLSVVNEGAAEAAYFSGNIATALAPLATYFSALGGLQGVMILLLSLLFPQRPTVVNSIQIFAVVLIAVGVFLLEGWKYL